METFKNNWFNFSCVFILAVLILTVRILVLLKFAFLYTDADQTIIWYATREYSNLNFHEPFFFGQNYSVLVESFVAAPFLKLGAHPWIILPIVTSFLILAPFFLLVFFICKNVSPHAAIIALTVWCLLPVEWDLLTSMPRGLVQGVSLAALSYLLIFNVTTYKKIFFAFFLNAIAIVFNPNSLLLSVYLFTFLICTQWRNYKFYVTGFCALLIPGAIFLLFKYFYVAFPNHLVHNIPLQFTYDYRLIIKLFTNSGRYFNFINPFGSESDFPAFAILLLIPVILIISKKTNETIAFLSSLLVIIISFGFYKIHDGNQSLFFNNGRMFFAVPFLLIVPLIHSKKFALKKRYLIPILVISMLSCFLKMNSFSEKVGGIIKKHDNILEVSTIKDLEEDCKCMNKIYRNNKVQLFLLSKNSSPSLNYACPAIYKNINVLMPFYERKSWLLEEFRNKKFNELFFCVKNEVNISLPNTDFKFIQQYKKNYYYSLKGDSLSLNEWLSKINF